MKKIFAIPIIVVLVGVISMLLITDSDDCHYQFTPRYFYYLYKSVNFENVQNEISIYSNKYPKEDQLFELSVVMEFEDSLPSYYFIFSNGEVSSQLRIGNFYLLIENNYNSINLTDHVSFGLDFVAIGEYRCEISKGYIEPQIIEKILASESLSVDFVQNITPISRQSLDLLKTFLTIH